MELNVVLVILSCLAVILSVGAFLFSLFAFIETQAAKRSTHTVMPVGHDTTVGDIEAQIKKITGQGREDFGRDLHSVGIDEDELV